MARITSGVGLVSGLNTSALIGALLQVDQQPVTRLQNRITQVTAQKAAYTSLTNQLNGIQQIGTALQRPDTFGASTATSSDDKTLTATAGPNATVGTYQFQVSRLVSAQQSVTDGFASTSALVGAGTITVEVGGGNLNTQTPLAQLNGGQGVTPGKFRVTDAAGKSDVIDTASAVTLNDVVKQINTALDVSVKASIQGDRLVIADTSSGSSGSLTVQDLGGGTTASELGIAGAAPDGVTLTGADVNTLGASTALNALNDGRGVRTVKATNPDATGADFRIGLGDGSAVDVTLGDSQSLGDVIKTINKSGTGKVVAAVGSDGKGLTLTDKSGGAGAFTVSELNGSNAAADLGIFKTGAGGVIAGNRLVAGLDSVLVSSLNGGKGLSLGQLSLTDRAGHTTAVDLSGAKSVQDILDTLNGAAATGGVGVAASLNSSGVGVQLKDTSGGTGSLVVADADAKKTATALGLAGSFDATVPAAVGSNLQLQWVNENSRLSKYNAGKGVTPGSFKITNAAGNTATVDLSKGTFDTIGDVIAAINGTKIGVTASIDATGNGLLLTDATAGKNKLTVENVGGTTATDLNIAGTASDPTGKVIDGTFEKTIAVNAADTLQTVQNKIQQLGFGVGAALINDGSAGSPYRLSLTALNSGTAGRFIFDGGATALQTHDLVQAQDAAVYLGGAGAARPLLITSSTNQLTNVIPGVTVNLTGVSDTPVTLTIARDPDSISKQLDSFVTDFNSVVDTITKLSSYDTSTNTAGLLLGDATTQSVQEEIYTVVNAVVKGAGRYRTLADLGVTVTDGAKLKFDKDKFSSAYATDPTAVGTLFTQAKTGLGTVLTNSMNRVVDPVTGALPVESKTLDSETQQYKDRITELNAVIQDKQNLYQQQFANMESVLAGLQGQQAALSTLSALTTSAATSSGTTSSGAASGGATSSGSTSTAAASPTPTSTSSGSASTSGTG